MSYSELFFAALPDLIVVLGMFLALGYDYTKFKDKDLTTRANKAATLSSIALLLGLAGVIWQYCCATEAPTNWDGQLVLTPLTLGFKALVFVLALFVIQFSKPQVPNQHVSEYFGLILLSTLGMGFVITAQNLIMFFVALELISLSLYGLTAFQNKKDFSVEAGVKYFAIGGVSSAFLLYGLSYLYGATHALNFADITAALQSGQAPASYLLIAATGIVVGLGFKIAAAPFHLWAPDTYQCAPVPVAAWIATGSKIASFFVLIQLFGPLLEHSIHRETLITSLVVISVISMVLGNIGALRQTCVKRLLAYSSVAHAGYILIGLLSANKEGYVSILFYTIIYSCATLGAFTIIGIINDRLGREANIDDFNGCWKQNPRLSLLFMIFILSLAGIPPLSGFFGKLYLFMAAIGSQPEITTWNEGFYWLISVALMMSAVSLFYYVKVLKAFLVSNDNPTLSSIQVGKLEGLGLIVLAVLTVGLGIYPTGLVEFIASYL
ncbi:NADH-quinone oxidoreductase subunit N [Opitutia bacterium ISCC 51]|nr:NADH-quinone oxidoreductase subunit N [Opitutae bacterium ISCC 51]QXD28963.1 NADH-quinone oxidoreductase subunit N [Opitutae bacterium ISCC 52]